MEEPRWNTGADEYRCVQLLVRAGRYREALERADQALGCAHLGRKHTARLHSLICWLYTEPLQEPGPVAALHGEEAVRLARLVNDVWIKCESLARLIQTYCCTGDFDRAEFACDEIAAELEDNPVVLDGGETGLWLLRATVAAAAGRDQDCLLALERAEESADPESVFPARIRARQGLALLALERRDEARRLLERARSDDAVPETLLPRSIVRAWLAAEEQGPEAAAESVAAALSLAMAADDPGAVSACLALRARVLERETPAEARHSARLALNRAAAAGRCDLVRRYRRTVGHLLGV